MELEIFFRMQGNAKGFLLQWNLKFFSNGRDCERFFIRTDCGLEGNVKDEEEYDPFKEEEVSQNYKEADCDKCFFLEWAAFVSLIGGLISSLIAGPLEKRTLWGLQLWKWFLMVLFVFCGRLVSGWIIHAAVFMLERNFLFRKRVLYFVYGLRSG